MNLGGNGFFASYEGPELVRFISYNLPRLPSCGDCFYELGCFLLLGTCNLLLLPLFSMVLTLGNAKVYGVLIYVVLQEPF